MIDRGLVLEARSKPRGTRARFVSEVDGCPATAGLGRKTSSSGTSGERESPRRMGRIQDPLSPYDLSAISLRVSTHGGHERNNDRHRARRRWKRRRISSRSEQNSRDERVKLRELHSFSSIPSAAVGHRRARLRLPRDKIVKSKITFNNYN